MLSRVLEAMFCTENDTQIRHNLEEKVSKYKQNCRNDLEALDVMVNWGKVPCSEGVVNVPLKGKGHYPSIMDHFGMSLQEPNH